jgi:hypothetical protein
MPPSINEHQRNTISNHDGKPEVLLCRNQTIAGLVRSGTVDNENRGRMALFWDSNLCSLDSELFSKDALAQLDTLQTVPPLRTQRGGLCFGAESAFASAHSETYLFDRCEQS